MKNLLGKLLTVMVLALGIASCAKNDDSWYEEQLRQQQLERKRIDSTLNAQKPILAAYAAEHLGDSRQRNDSTGIWFEVLEEGIADSYIYRTSGGQIIAPTVTVKYIGRLVSDGTIFEQTAEGKNANFELYNVIPAWQIAFLPQTINHNGVDREILGLTENGLMKGSKIRFVAPSPYCYDRQAKDKVPANSPLDFTIEVVDIR